VGGECGLVADLGAVVSGQVAGGVSERHHLSVDAAQEEPFITDHLDYTGIIVTAAGTDLHGTEGVTATGDTDLPRVDLLSQS